MTTPSDSGLLQRGALSSAWTFVVLNMLLRDVHELFRPGLLAEMMTGTVNGIEMTEGFLLGAAAVVEIPVLMVVLAWVLSARLYRRLTLALVPLVVAATLVTAVGDLDDAFFAAVEVAALAFAAWTAWRWPARSSSDFAQPNAPAT